MLCTLLKIATCSIIANGIFYSNITVSDNKIINRDKKVIKKIKLPVNGKPIRVINTQGKIYFLCINNEDAQHQLECHNITNIIDSNGTKKIWTLALSKNSKDIILSRCQNRDNQNETNIYIGDNDILHIINIHSGKIIYSKQFPANIVEIAHVNQNSQTKLVIRCTNNRTYVCSINPLDEVIKVNYIHAEFPHNFIQSKDSIAIFDDSYIILSCSSKDYSLIYGIKDGEDYFIKTPPKNEDVVEAYILARIYIVGSSIVCIYNNRKIVASNMDGNNIWTYTLPHFVNNIIVEKDYILYQSNNRIHSIDPTNGFIREKVDFKKTNITFIRVFNNIIIAGSERALFLLNQKLEIISKIDIKINESSIIFDEKEYLGFLVKSNKDIFIYLVNAI
ncbi:hypothetical protein [Candidatus Gromoviella agglomerans]|uniref:hypothetical protein n=1 Tax=Candidatus Gromoviella agglomerans TaxID=2806609 RepID=UPI001E62A644|nr:hypothetical protein [Candidatus Gromoviella agglomerans]UFX98508.1 hypothetical protein Gromo_00418 [Candidatus Gromoviella agglomerans]